MLNLYTEMINMHMHNTILILRIMSILNVAPLLLLTANVIIMPLLIFYDYDFELFSYYER